LSLILQGSWSDHYNKKRGKKKKKGTPPWYVKVGGHPKDSVSHGLRKEKWGGEPNYKRAYKCLLQQFGTALNLFSMEDSKNSVASR
jgi:hypothetical protein